MKKMMAICLIVVALLSLGGIANAAVYVGGYTKSNGTYVAPHYRSDPDGYSGNNWSTYPNINPYTGKMGTKKFW